MKWVVVFIVCYFCIPIVALGAPPPSEVKEAKDEAPIHVVGTVVDDELVEDLTEEKGHASQTRIMTLEVHDVIRNETALADLGTVNVHYFYYPKWAASYSGPARMDIAVGDTVEIWLEKRDGVWQSVMSGTSVRHLVYAEERPIHIKEPWSNKLKLQVDKDIWIPLILLFIIGVVIGLIQYRRRDSRHTYS